MKGFYFIEDTYLQWLELDSKIKRLIENLEKKYFEQIIDEVFIFNYDWKIVLPVYFLCAHKNCIPPEIIDKNKSEQIKEQKLKDFNYFIDNVLKNLCIINYEGLIAKDQTWWMFDWMFRIDNYYIWLTNSNKTLRELFDNNVLSEKDFIDAIKEFYKELFEK